jgi:hypothetical protein
MTEKPISERERRFCIAWVGSANGVGAAAAKSAGYKGSQKVLTIQAGRLLSKASVQAEIAALRAQSQSDGILTATECAVRLSGIGAGVLTERKVTSSRGRSSADEDDFVEVDTPPSFDTQIKAIQTLAKLRGYEAPTKQEHSGTVGLELTLTAEQDAALAEYLEMRDDPIIKARMAELRGEG